MPVPNRGLEAAALAKLSAITNELLKLVTDMGPASDVGRDVLKAINLLAKHVPPGSQQAGIQNTAMMNMMRQAQQQGPLAALMAARGGQGQPPPVGAPALPPPAAA